MNKKSNFSLIREKIEFFLALVVSGVLINNGTFSNSSNTLLLMTGILSVLALTVSWVLYANPIAIHKWFFTFGKYHNKPWRF